MSPCLLDTGSPLTCLDPELMLIAGFDVTEFEDQIAELTVEKCHINPFRAWQQCDIGDLVSAALQNLSPYNWEKLDSELIKGLVIAATNVVKQIIPIEDRQF